MLKKNEQWIILLLLMLQFLILLLFNILLHMYDVL